MTDATFDAWHLPGVEVEEVETLEVGQLTCRYPVPTPDFIDACVRGLRAAGRELAERSVADVVAAIDAAAARLADAGDPLRREAETRLVAAIGYSPEMATLVLDRMAADWRAEPLRGLLTAELGDPSVLDEFRPVDGRMVRAYGPSLAFHVFAGNVPGVAVTSLVRSLLVKAPALGKLASGQPVLPVLFARAVADSDPGLARALAVTYWPGGDVAAEQRALEAADTVVAYGGEEAIAAIRERTAGTRLVVHGPRFSVGLVGRAALDDDPAGLARRVARSVAVFDQHGCVSPHAVWVEEGTGAGAAEFAEALAEALEEVERELPRGRLGPAEASAIQQERAAAELKGHESGAPDIKVLTGEGTRWTVIYDPESAFRPSCLNRLIRVHPVAVLEDAIDVLAPVGRFLQSVAVAGVQGTALAHELARIGATRITSFDGLPWPPPHWHHDGQEPLRELLRWVDLEAR